MDYETEKLLKSYGTRMGLLLLIISIYITPLITVLITIGYFALRRRFKKSITLLGLAVIPAITILVAFIGSQSILEAVLSPFISLMRGLGVGKYGIDGNAVGLGRELWIWFVGRNFHSVWLTASMMLLMFALHTSSEEILMGQYRREQRELAKIVPDAIDLDSNHHTWIQGTTGAGKTTASLQYVQEAVEKNQFIAIVDGKADLDEHGLLEMVRKLAKMHNRKVRVVNQGDIADTDAYNPFVNLTATQIKDFLMSLGGPWSEEHFKALAARYWQMMAGILLRFNQTVNFKTLLKYSVPEELFSLVQQLRIQGLIDTEEYDELARIIKSEAGKQAEIASNRLAVVYEGDGQAIFDLENGEAFNLRSAYEENAVVVCLISKFQYGDFADSLARLILDDMKQLVGAKLASRISTTADNSRALLIFDELSAYVTEDFNYFLSQSRSANFKCILATQLIQDIERVNEGVANQLMGNCKEYVIMQTPDPYSSETISNYIGTRVTIEQTDRASEALLMNETSNKVVHTFKLHPQNIRELE